MLPHYNIVIATPGRSFHPGYVKSLVRTIETCHALGLTVTMLSQYSSFVPTAREMTAANVFGHDYTSNKIGGGEFTYDVVIWIDSDIEWEPDDLLLLYESDHDIISGLYVLDQMGTVAVGYTNADGVYTRVNKVEFLLHEEPVEVSAVGFGFLAVKSGVFESIPRPWFLIGKMKWDANEEMRVNVGEDYSWCGRAQQHGYTIMVDPLVRVLHHKETVYEV